MEEITEQEIEKLKLEAKENKIKEIHETTIFEENQIIQKIEIIREKNKPIITNIAIKPDEIVLNFDYKNN